MPKLRYVGEYMADLVVERKLIVGFAVRGLRSRNMAALRHDDELLEEAVRQIFSGGGTPARQ